MNHLFFLIHSLKKPRDRAVVPASLRFGLGELIGTFLLVFFGCGSVILALAFGSLGHFEVAAIWGLGLTVAILLTGPISGAHLNPAMSLAFVVTGKLPWRLFPIYAVSQLMGAFLAAVVLYQLFGGQIAAFEEANGIVRGQDGSEASAMMFGEYFPNPGGRPLGGRDFDQGTQIRAVLAEALGTGMLAFSIFSLIHPKNTKQPDRLTPLWIGITLTVLIAILAPLSQAGFNPARDFAPRLLSAVAGWGDIPFTGNRGGWFWVYIVPPFVGAPVGALIAEWLFSDRHG